MPATLTAIVAHDIDQLGSVKAEIAKLKELEKVLTARVAQMGHGAFDGTYYRAAISEVAEGKTLDAKAAEAKLRELGVDGRWFSKNMKTRDAYTTVRVSARKSS